jgi:hypothetical protein
VATSRLDDLAQTNPIVGTLKSCHLIGLRYECCKDPVDISLAKEHSFLLYMSSTYSQSKCSQVKLHTAGYVMPPWAPRPDLLSKSRLPLAYRTLFLLIVTPQGSTLLFRSQWYFESENMAPIEMTALALNQPSWLAILFNAIQGKGISHGVSIKKVNRLTIRPPELFVKVYSVARVSNQGLQWISSITYILKEAYRCGSY